MDFFNEIKNTAIINENKNAACWIGHVSPCFLYVICFNSKRLSDTQGLCLLCLVFILNAKCN